MHAAGVRGVRFNFVKRLVDATPKEVFETIAEKIQAFGWHIVVYFEAADLESLMPFLRTLPTHHRGRSHGAAGCEQGRGSPGFSAVHRPDGREPEYLDQGDLPGAPFASGPAL